MTRTREEIEAELGKIHYHDEERPLMLGIAQVLKETLYEVGQELAEAWLMGDIDVLLVEDTND